jgi:hypothetical protein
LDARSPTAVRASNGQRRGKFSGRASAFQFSFCRELPSATSQRNLEER